MQLSAPRSLNGIGRHQDGGRGQQPQPGRGPRHHPAQGEEDPGGEGGQEDRSGKQKVIRGLG